MGIAYPPSLSALQDAPAATRCVLQAGFSADDAEWLQLRIGTAMQVLHCAPTREAVQAALTPAVQMVVVQFDVRQDLEAPVLLAQWLREHQPELSILGMGYANTAKVPLAALRGGVHDFLDMAGAVDELLKPFWTLSMRASPAAVQARDAAAALQGQSIALLGARAGMGVSTLAVHLAAALVQGLPARTPAGKDDVPAAVGMGVGLLDLGFPLRDGLMQLGLTGSFHMLDAIQSMHRLDPALLEAALPRHGSGTAVLAWPGQAHALRDVSPPSTAAMVQRLRAFFAWQVVDVGGLPAPEMVQATAQAADQVWAVCDQSVGGIVSLSELLKTLPLRSDGKPLCSGLVVNRAYRDAGMPAADIAQRLGLPLLHVLPPRGGTLLQASSRGMLLSEMAPADAYVQEVQQMAARLLGGANGGAVTAAISGAGSAWVQRWRGALRRGSVA